MLSDLGHSLKACNTYYLKVCNFSLLAYGYALIPFDICYIWNKKLSRNSINLW
jgi:hypothetical protein